MVQPVGAALTDGAAHTPCAIAAQSRPRLCNKAGEHDKHEALMSACTLPTPHARTVNYLYNSQYTWVALPTLKKIFLV